MTRLSVHNKTEGLVLLYGELPARGSSMEWGASGAPPCPSVLLKMLEMAAGMHVNAP